MNKQPAGEKDDIIAHMRKRILQFVSERNWQQFHNPKDMAVSLALEAAEVLEHFQWKNEAEVTAYLAKHKDKVGEELCDCLYWILYMAHTFDIDLEQAFEQKMRKNEAKYPVEQAHSSHKKYTQLSRSPHKS